eukprot:4230742-Alexandrium_andersonii.AAC.1
MSSPVAWPTALPAALGAPRMNPCFSLGHPVDRRTVVRPPPLAPLGAPLERRASRAVTPRSRAMA